MGTPTKRLCSLCARPLVEVHYADAARLTLCLTCDDGTTLVEHLRERLTPAQRAFIDQPQRSV